MAKVKVRNGESLEQALRRFNREVLKSGVLQLVKDRARFVKPSEIKRQKAKELARKIRLETKRSK
jgi:small subunit ribosomal protein S21